MYPEFARKREIFKRIRECDLYEIGTGWNTYSFRCHSRPSAAAFFCFRIFAVSYLLRATCFRKCHLDIWSETSGFYINRCASLGVFSNRFIVFEFCTFFGSSTETVGIFFTAHKDAATPKFEFHWASADGAGEFARHVAERCRLRELIFRMHRLLERTIKCSERLFVAALAARDLIEFVFHLCRERVDDIFGEMFLEPTRHDHAGRCWFQRASKLVDIPAIRNCFHNRGVCRWTADTALLEFLDKTRFGVAVRRFGFLLFRSK